MSKDNNDLQLKEQLKAELDSLEPDQEKVLELLNQLEQSMPVNEIPVDVLAAWQKAHSEKKKPKRNMGKILGAVAAVLVLMVLIVPPVLGAENIFQLIGRWSDSIFSFGKEIEQPKAEFKTEHEGLQKLYDEVQGLGLASNVVPTWLPEGYVLDEIIIQDHVTRKTIIASFVAGEDYIIYKAEVMANKCDTEFQKDSVDVKIREIFGVKHYIVCNDGGWIAMWSADEAVCTISADSFDMVEKIISSIYSMEV